MKSALIFFRGPEVKTSPLFFWQVFVNFMEKELCTKFCVVLIRFHEVIKLQSSEFSVSNVKSANVQNMLPLVFFAFFIIFMEQKPPTKFYSVFNHFYEVLIDLTVSKRN